MTTPEWTLVDEGLRSLRQARRSVVTVLVALGLLGGIGLGIPIGREQQARANAQRHGMEAAAEAWRDVLAPRPLPPARGDEGAVTHPRGSIEL